MSFVKLLKYSISSNLTCTGVLSILTYLSLVRLSLEYASSVWDTYCKTHNLTIEKVQRKAIRWTLGNYDYHSSVSAM